MATMVGSFLKIKKVITKNISMMDFEGLYGWKTCSQKIKSSLYGFSKVCRSQTSCSFLNLKRGSEIKEN